MTYLVLALWPSWNEKLLAWEENLVVPDYWTALSHTLIVHRTKTFCKSWHIRNGCSKLALQRSFKPSHHRNFEEIYFRCRDCGNFITCKNFIKRRHTSKLIPWDASVAISRGFIWIVFVNVILLLLLGKSASQLFCVMHAKLLVWLFRLNDLLKNFPSTWPKMAEFPSLVWRQEMWATWHVQCTKLQNK